MEKSLRGAGYDVVNFGNSQLNADDDYPEYAVPLAPALAIGAVCRGVALCGSGVGVCIVANKVTGVRASLIHEMFPVHRGVEDDDMNLICQGGRVIVLSAAWELGKAFLDAQFSGAVGHRRRLAKVAELESENGGDDMAVMTQCPGAAVPATSSHVVRQR
jgi:ribose 5-phosphate isomerase B